MYILYSSIHNDNVLGICFNASVYDLFCLLKLVMGNTRHIFCYIIVLIDFPIFIRLWQIAFTLSEKCYFTKKVSHFQKTSLQISFRGDDSK